MNSLGIKIDKTEAVSTADLFTAFYAVPDFQREFVWKKRQIVRLLEDIFLAFNSGDDDNYFIGSIVVVDDQNTFSIVDGQQRLTSLYLLFAAIRDRLKVFDPNAGVSTLEKVIADTDTLPDGEEVMRYRLQLQYKPTNKVLIQLASGDREEIELAKQEPGRGHLNAYDYCMAFLKEKFGEEDSAGLKKFHAFVLKRLELIRIITGDFQSALTIFEVLNYRGVLLNALDLLKNLIFRVGEPEARPELNATWSSMLSTLKKGGETKPLRFLRYFLVSHYSFDKMPKSSELFDWILDNEEELGYGKDTLGFVETLHEAAEDYVGFLQGFDVNDEECIPLQGIAFQKTSVRQHLPILMAGRHLGSTAFERLAHAVESLVFVFALAEAQWNEVEKVAPKWCQKIRKLHKVEDVQKFITNEISPMIREYSGPARERLRDTSTFGVGLRRYALARMTQWIEESCGKDEDLSKYFARKVTVEHILPQNPGDEWASFDGDPTEYVARLGNLILLYGVKNSILQRKSFADKAGEIYADDDYELSKSVATDIRKGAKTKFTKTADRYGLKPFDEWTAESIAGREEMLLRIASDIWDMH